MDNREALTLLEDVALKIVGSPPAIPLVIGRDGLLGVLREDNQKVESLESWDSLPSRSRGYINVTSPTDFARLVAKLENGADSRIYYMRNGMADAILNDDAGDTADWRDWRVCYRPELARSWESWTRTFPQDKANWMDQLVMAEFLEERASDFVNPTGAAMLDLAQNFSIVRAGKFSSAKRLDNGSYSLDVADEHQPRGSIEIPSRVKLGMRVFEGMGAYQFEAAFRYRIGDGGSLRMTFRILHSDAVLETAVNDTIDTIARALGKDATARFVRVGTLPPDTRPL